MEIPSADRDGALGRSWVASTAPSASGFLAGNNRNTNAPSANAVTAATMTTMVVPAMSVLHSHDDGHPDRAEHQQHRRDDHRDDSNDALEEHRSVVRLDDREQEEQSDRKDNEDDTRHSTLRTESGHLASDLIPLTNGPCDLVKHLGKVATRLRVDRDGLSDPFEILALHPLGSNRQSFRKRASESRLVHRAREFLTHGS